MRASGELVSAARHWARQLTFLAPDAAEDYGTLMEMIEEFLPFSRSQGLDQEPSGWSGLTRQGPWSRLLHSEWALSESAPEEFLRRASQGELSFWQRGFEGQLRGQESWLMFDSGPEQLGACRILQLGLLFLFSCRAQRVGSALYWSLAQFPDKAYEEVSQWSLRAFLEGRSLDMPGPPNLVSEVPPSRVWLIGGRSWRGHIPAGCHYVQLSEQERGTVDLNYAGRSRRLPLPPAHRALRLFRDPFSVSRSRSASSALSSHGRLFYSSCGRKILLVTEDRITVQPVPQSPKEPLGNRRQFVIPQGQLLALGWWQGALSLLMREQDTSWSLRRLNPARHDGQCWLGLKALIQVQEVGTCLLDHGTYILWIEGQLWRISPGQEVEILFMGALQGARLCGSQTLLVSEGKVFNRRLRELVDLGQIEPEASQAHKVWLGQGGQISVSELDAVVALQFPNRIWRLMWEEQSQTVHAESDQVIGVVALPRRGSPALVEQHEKSIVLRGPDFEEQLETADRICQVAVSDRTGNLAWQLEDGSIWFYSTSLGLYLGESAP